LAAAGGFYADGYGVVLSVVDLNQQIAALSSEIDQHKARINRIHSQFKELASKIDQNRRATAHSEIVTKVNTERDQRDIYLKALRSLRESVDATKRHYGDLVDNAKVRAALTAKNRGSPRNKFSLGPSPQFGEIEKKLKLHEVWVKSNTSSRSGPGDAKMSLTPAGGLPPDF
jgi:chromosome segregation ATPase